MYRAGRYSEAIGKFQASFDAKPVSKVLLDIGLAHLRLKNGRDATFFFNYYLRDALRVPPTVRADVERYLQEAHALEGGALTPTAQAPRSDAAHAQFAAVSIPPATRAAPPVPAPRTFQEPDWHSPSRPPRPPPPAAPAPVEPSADGTVPVRFGALDRHTRYLVAVSGQSCTTPCLLPLRPGHRYLTVQGPSSFRSDLEVPPQPARVRLRHLTVAPLVAGVVLTPLGLAGAGVGVAYLASTTFTPEQEHSRVTIGAPLLAVGLALTLGGVISLSLIRPARAEIAALPDNP